MLTAWVAVLRLVVFDCYSLVGLLLLVLDGLVVDLVFVGLGWCFVALLTWFLGRLVCICVWLLVSGSDCWLADLC